VNNSRLGKEAFMVQNSWLNLIANKLDGKESYKLIKHFPLSIE
jgi:hypothetical protein